MNYFTKEELEEITIELLNSPTRDTLGRLNDKYNGKPKEEIISTVSVTYEPPVVAPTETIVETPVVQNTPKVPEVNNIPNPVPDLSVPTMEVPNEVKQNPNTEITIPSFELPKLETPLINNQNNTPIEFTGNLFETQMFNVGNLMETTENFNAPQNSAPVTEVPVTNGPFFGATQTPVNNPIPVGGTPSQGPTMFGQFEQNYM